MYTLLYLKWVTNKNLLYSTGNSAQYLFSYCLISSLFLHEFMLSLLLLFSYNFCIVIFMDNLEATVFTLNSSFFFFLILFIYLFIYGCVGSSFLCKGFLQLRQAGATLHHGARASHYCSLSCCGAQAPDAQAQ